MAEKGEFELEPCCGHLSPQAKSRASSEGQHRQMAERVGFEPTLEFPLNTLSKRAPSATRPPLRLGIRGARIIT